MSNFRKPVPQQKQILDLEGFVQRESFLAEPPTKVVKANAKVDTKPTGIYLTNEQRRWLKFQAIDADCNVSEVVRRLLDQAMKTEES